MLSALVLTCLAGCVRPYVGERSDTAVMQDMASTDGHGGDVSGPEGGVGDGAQERDPWVGDGSVDRPPPGFHLLPAYRIAHRSESVSLRVVNGVGAIQLTVMEGSATVDSAARRVTLGEGLGSVRVRATDQQGNTAESLIMVVPHTPFDDAFGRGGHVVETVGATTSVIPTGLARRRDGVLAVAGSAISSAGADFFVQRYRRDGLLDTGFGAGGSQLTDAGTSEDFARDVVFDARGRIVVVGESMGEDRNGVIVRYDYSGALDQAFADGGVRIEAQTTTTPSHEMFYAAALSPDGLLHVAGTINEQYGNGWFNHWIIRLTDSGERDTDFGMPTIAGPGSISIRRSSWATPKIRGNDMALAIQFGPGDAKRPFSIRLLGNCSHAVCRPRGLTHEGLFNPSIEPYGHGIFTARDKPTAMVGLADGSVVAVGTAGVAAERQAFAVRILDDGNLDESFGSAGIWSLSVPERPIRVNGVAVAGDGKVVITGRIRRGSRDVAWVARLSKAGVLDASFGDGGTLELPISATDAEAVEPLVLSDGSVIVLSRGGGNVVLSKLRAQRPPKEAAVVTVATALSTLTSESPPLTLDRALAGWPQASAMEVAVAEANEPPGTWQSMSYQTSVVLSGLRLVSGRSYRAFVRFEDGQGGTSPIFASTTWLVDSPTLPLPYDATALAALPDQTLADTSISGASVTRTTPLMANALSISGVNTCKRGEPTALFLLAQQISFTDGAILSAAGQDAMAPGTFPGGGGEGGSGGGTGGYGHDGYGTWGGSAGGDGEHRSADVRGGKGWARIYAEDYYYGMGGEGGFGQGCCPPRINSGVAANGGGGGGGGSWTNRPTGGGGGGGGLIVLVAGEIRGAGILQAMGGAALGAGGARGGGGGGGVIWVAAKKYDGKLQVSVDGGGGSALEQGAAGSAFIFQILPDGTLAPRTFAETW